MAKLPNKIMFLSAEKTIVRVFSAEEHKNEALLFQYLQLFLQHSSAQ